MENRAVFWLMGRSWPLHKAQPAGAKLKPTILISPMNGSDIIVGAAEVSVASGKDALERDAEVEDEIGRHVVVRLIAAGGTDRLGRQGRIGTSGRIVPARGDGRIGARRTGRIRVIRAS